MNNRDFKLTLIDGIASFIALSSSFFLRFDFEIPNEFKPLIFSWAPIFSFFQIMVFYFSGLYARIWRYTSLFDLYAILSASATAYGISIIYVLFTSGPVGYPRSVLLIYFLLNVLFVVGIRLSVRIYFSHYAQSGYSKKHKPPKTLLIIGAGKTGEKIAREIRTTENTKYKIAGFIDDDISKHGALLHGKKIYGSVKNILNMNIKYDEILITVPSATGDQMRNIVKICKNTGKRYRTVPSTAELIDGEKISLDFVRDVSYTDLLGREEVSLDMNSIEDLIKGKRVLISGAGGSIGSELVKQCILFEPSELICLDMSEEKIFHLEQSFETTHTKTIFKTVLGSVNDKKECEKIFIDNRPQIVFHAAAYKHVPIQELHPWTAVKTNIGGTYNLVKFSEKYSVDKFVLVSTDKAVNPVNVMGATKRIAERLIQSFNVGSKTKLMAVRFGNVLGSSGSAIPSFQKQINEGGPLTITHPEMTRYFMSLQEASQLILQCGALGKDGEIFLLEMGKPIKILQMAKDLIRLSGLEPDIDIPIVYVGLRPGEKLYEELQLLNEKKVLTSHKKIMILKQKEIPVPWNYLEQNIISLLNAAEQLDKNKIQELLKALSPSYTPRNFNNIPDDPVTFPIKVEA